MGWLWKKMYKWCVKRRENRIDKAYERTKYTRTAEMDIAGYINTKVSPMCDLCKKNHSKYVVSTRLLGNGRRERNYCEGCFLIGGARNVN